MALNTQMSNAAVNAEADALTALCASGYIRLYDNTGGTGQPANANTSLGSQVKLAELRFQATAAPAASNGVITFNTLTSDTNAPASGTVSWFRVLKSDGTTVLFDGTVGTATSNMIIATTTITAGQTVSCSSFTHTVQKATAGL